MAKQGSTAEQITAKLREAEVEPSTGVPNAQVCKKVVLRGQTHHGWRWEYNTIRSHNSPGYRSAFSSGNRHSLAAGFRFAPADAGKLGLPSRAARQRGRVSGGARLR